MKLIERMPRGCKAVIKAKGGYFEESQITNIKYILVCLKLFGVLPDTTCFFHSFVVFTTIPQCRI
jgi:hypothetical protein